MANRVGISEVVEAVRAGEAGAIYVSAIDRLGRNDYESLGLIKDCIRRDVVIVENGTDYNPRDLRQLIPLRFKTFLAEIENINRQIRIHDAMEAFIKRGEEFTCPPVGYVRSDDRTSWVKDPDPRVRGAIESVFRIFAEERTVPKTVRRLKAEGIQLPRREQTRRMKRRTDEAEGQV
jgi:DNA invertase Pin-like site-specific DNA recombinase